jgi:hypothetical protein
LGLSPFLHNKVAILLFIFPPMRELFLVRLSH